MNILVFTTLYPNNIWPNHGVFVKERMTRVARLEACRLKVVAPVPYSPAVKLGWRWRFSRVAQQEVIEGVEVYHPRYLMTPKVGMSLYGMSMFLSLLPKVKEIQRSFAFDLIDAHYVYPDGFAALLLGRFFRKPVVVSARGSDINLFATLPIIRRLLQFTLRRADKVIAVCQALRQGIMQLGIPEEDVIVVPNGVDPDKFYPFSKQEARRSLGLPAHKTILLSVGGLVPIKGFDFLIKALKLLLKRIPGGNLHLVIVGQGPCRRKLEKLVSALHLDGDVFLAGPASHQDLYLWYNAADLFCLASSREGWPNVLLESLACGTPVVATKVSGIPEVVRSDLVGLLTERNEQEIAKAISLALQKRWRHEEIAGYARQQTWERVAESVYKVFASVLDPAR